MTSAPFASSTLPFSCATGGQWGSPCGRRFEVTRAISASDLIPRALSEIDDLFAECHVAGWDGYGAKAVSVYAYDTAKLFIQGLPADFPTPTISADTDGCVTFEWKSSARRILLVSVHPNFRIDYAALFGTARHYGSEPFFGQLPKAVRVLVRQVFLYVDSESISGKRYVIASDSDRGIV